MVEPPTPLKNDGVRQLGWSAAQDIEFRHHFGAVDQWITTFCRNDADHQWLNMVESSFLWMKNPNFGWWNPHFGWWNPNFGWLNPQFFCWLNPCVWLVEPHFVVGLATILTKHKSSLVPYMMFQIFNHVPSRNLTVCYWKLPFKVDLPIKNDDFPQLC